MQMIAIWLVGLMWVSVAFANCAWVLWEQSDVQSVTASLAKPITAYNEHGYADCVKSARSRAKISELELRTMMNSSIVDVQLGDQLHSGAILSLTYKDGTTRHWKFSCWPHPLTPDLAGSK